LAVQPSWDKLVGPAAQSEQIQMFTGKLTNTIKSFPQMGLTSNLKVSNKMSHLPQYKPQIIRRAFALIPHFW
jgi:hypothetical protein